MLQLTLYTAYKYIPSAHCSGKALYFLFPLKLCLKSSKFSVRALHHKQQKYFPGGSDCCIGVSLIYRDSGGLFTLVPTLRFRLKNVALHSRDKACNRVNVPSLLFTACSTLPFGNVLQQPLLPQQLPVSLVAVREKRFQHQNPLLSLAMAFLNSVSTESGHPAHSQSHL